MSFASLVVRSGKQAPSSVSRRIRSVPPFGGLDTRSRRLSSTIAASIALTLWSTASMAAPDQSKSELKLPSGGRPGICSAAAALLLPGGATLAAKSVGTTAVLHSSNAFILTAATGGYVGNTLGTLAATALGVLTAPATIWVVGTAAVVGAIGSTYCLVTRIDTKSPKQVRGDK